MFEVEDSGVGIKREDMGKLFTLYSRVTAGHDEKMSGIGLGLAISQSLVRLMNNGAQGGKITVESRYGQGSLFRFPLYVESDRSELFEELITEDLMLPVFLTSNGRRRPEAAVEDRLIDKAHKEKIKLLVVDDDQLNLLVAANYLKTAEEQFSYQLAANGEQAIRAVLENAAMGYFFDVILMDCNMPVMDGFDATRRLKTLMKEEKICFASVVALTGNSSQADLKSCADAGMEFVLSKPY